MRRMFSTVLLAVFLASAFAGCVEEDPEDDTKPRLVKKGAVSPDVYLDKLSKALYTEILREEIFVPSFDGKGMENWVFRPKVPDGTKVPVFINFSPYWYNSAGDASLGGDGFSAY